MASVDRNVDNQTVYLHRLIHGADERITRISVTETADSSPNCRQIFVGHFGMADNGHQNSPISITKW
jgi:spore coat protein CotF